MQAHVETREEKKTEHRHSALRLPEWDAINRGIRLRRDLRRARAEMKHPNARRAHAALHRARVLIEELAEAEVALVAMSEARRAARGGAR